MRSCSGLAKGASFAALWLLAACASLQPLGEPLRQGAGAPGYRFSSAAPERHDDDLLLIVTLSGGGNRAAALAYGALEQLAADRVRHGAGERRLLDDVDVISAVSGGSIVGAYFVQYGDALFRDFRQDYLYRDTQDALWRAMLLSPRNWVQLASKHYSRGDLLADYLDRRLFHGATFADLARLPNRPFLVINATDLAAGGRFEFTQDSFDMICTDLASFPLARAVAASSAYPVYVTPLSLANHAGGCGYRMPERLRAALGSEGELRERQLAEHVQAYQDTTHLRYLQLADGAMSDNLGLRAVIDVLVATGDPEEAQRRFGLAGIRRVAVIAVDASNDIAGDVGASSRPPGPMESAFRSSMLLVAEAEQENRALLHELLARMTAPTAGGAGSSIGTYWIDVSLADLQDAAQRERLQRIPTRLDVTPKEADELICSAHELLASQADYRRLLTDLAGSAPVSRPDCKHP